MTDFAYAVEGNAVTTTSFAAGPWDPRLQHGGAPSALAVWAAEQVETAAPMRVARVTVDLLRPVPVAELELETSVLREGRKIQLVQVRLMASGTEVTRAVILKARTTDQPLPIGVGMPAPELPPLEAGAGTGMGIAETNSFGTNFDIRRISGGFSQLGPGGAWFRQHRPLIKDRALSPAMRAVAVADFTNGVSALLPFAEWTFLNADLTVSLAREPEGEWIFSDAETWAGPDGTGTATALLADYRGYFGRATQSLIIDRRG